MKRIFALLLSLIFVILIIPAAISLLWMKEDKEKPPDDEEDIIVSVFKSSTGKTEKVALEKYLFGVLAGEMPASFHLEALKAQAVAARTYIINKKQNPDKESSHPDADICTDSTHCKAWLSDEEIKTRFGTEWLNQYKDKLITAINETKGEILLYENEPILAVFHSTGSGYTENSKDVWGGDLPYLKSVPSPGDESSPKFTSETKVSRDEFIAKLGSADIGEITNTEGGAVKSIVVGNKKWSGGEIREMFSLNSANFIIEEKDDTFIFHVKGNGHGVGMSQYGANALANDGNGYKEILETYYSGAYIGTL